jgi:hypothetical protein
MRFPWTKQSEKASNLLAIVDQSQTKVSELENELAVSRAELGQLQQTIERQGTLLSGMYEIIQKSAEAPPTYRWDNPWRYASPHSTKRKPEAIAPLELLRNFARTYDVLRSCINHLKREVRAVPFEIVSRDPDKKIPEERIKKAKEFFGRNGGLGGLHTRTRHFENAIFEDVMVIGAYAVFLWKKRNGTIHEAVALDASTIRPKVDVYGWQDPNEAFEQQILGVPYRTFGKDELLYDGLDPVTYSPYFVSPVEYLLGVIMSALSADNWNRSWLTDGNTPDALIAVPETWTPEQVIAYQEYFDAILSGNASERRKTRIVPSGTKSVVSQTRHEADFQEFETWLMRRTCSIMGVAPASIGYAGDQYKESQGESMRSTSVFGAGALLELRKDLYDDLLEMNGFADLEIRDVMAREEDPTVKADRLVKTTGGAFKTINEARSEEGLDPIEGGDVIRGLNDSPEEEDPDPFEPDDDEDETEEDDEQRLEDLAKWERKALKRLREGKGAQCEFRSDFLDEVEIRSIFDALGGCEAADEVATLFRYSKDQLRGPDGRFIAMAPVREFISSSISNTNFKGFMRVTSIGKRAGARIRKLSGVDLTGWEISLSADDIRHSMNRHGPGSTMAQNGQVPISASSFESAIKAITHPDSAVFEKGAKPGQPNLLKVNKHFGEDQLVTVSVTSTKRKTATIKTVYIV